MSADLLAAIAADPDNDLPRLVYADWLDDHGQPARAEFIRLQCHSARVGPLHPSWAPAKLREYDLFRANEAEWRPATAGEESRMLMARWRRGFPACVSLADVAEGRLTNGEWCNGSFDLFAGVPGQWYSPRRDPWPEVPVCAVSMSGWEPGSGELLRHERLRAVRSITLAEWYAGVSRVRIERFCDELTRLPADHLPELNSLNLGDGDLTLFAVEGLASAPPLATVTRLSLRFPDRIGAGDMARWAEATGELFRRFAQHAQRLVLEQLPPFLVPAFTAVPWPKLRTLRIVQRHLNGLAGFAATDAPNLSALSILPRTARADGVWPQDTFQTLARWSALRGVKVLSLPLMGDGVFRRFLDAASGAAFEFVSLARVFDGTGAFTLRELHDAAATRRLKGLYGSFTADLAPLADPKVLPELHTIWVNDPAAGPPLRWAGGVRTVIPPDADRHHPNRNQWLGWWDDLMG